MCIQFDAFNYVFKVLSSRSYVRKVLTGKASTLFPVNYVSYAWHGKLSLTKSQALLLCQMWPKIRVRTKSSTRKEYTTQQLLHIILGKGI